MDLQYYGGNCVVLSTKGVRLVFDDNLVELGQKSVTKPEDIILFTGVHGLPSVQTKLVVDGPGEYEVANVSIVGIAARANMDPGNTLQATMYKVVTDEASYLVTGHIYPELSDDQLETIGIVDVLIVPVGGNGYTVDPTGALHLSKQIEPKIVVPTHYAESGLHYPVEQQPLEQVLKNLGMEPKETVAKLHYKPGETTNTTQLILVTRA